MRRQVKKGARQTFVNLNLNLVDLIDRINTRQVTHAAMRRKFNLKFSKQIFAHTNSFQTPITEKNLLGFSERVKEAFDEIITNYQKKMKGEKFHTQVSSEFHDDDKVFRLNV